MRDRYGDEALPERFRAFDTICSATQDRQDAVKALLDERQVDLMVVIGGLNSSNTCNLARICARQVPTYHIADPEGLAVGEHIRHKPVGHAQEVTTSGWLPSGTYDWPTSGARRPTTSSMPRSAPRRIANAINHSHKSQSSSHNRGDVSCDL